MSKAIKMLKVIRYEDIKISQNLGTWNIISQIIQYSFFQTSTSYISSSKEFLTSQKYHLVFFFYNNKLTYVQKYLSVRTGIIQKEVN